MKIKFIIPTFNRVEKLKRSIKSLLDYSNKSKHEIEIFVVNNKSNDDTANYLAGLNNYKIKFINREKFIETGHGSTITTFTEVTTDSDWYWMFGDDDYIINENYEKLDRIFEKNEYDYIHATNEVTQFIKEDISGEIRNLVDKFGILEIFSFISSQIFSNEAVLNFKHELSKNKIFYTDEYCFIHTILFYKIIKSKIGYLISNPIVAIQPNRSSEQHADIWLKIPKFLSIMNEQKLIQKPLSKYFFNHQSTFLWRKYIIWYFEIYWNSSMSYPNQQYLAEAINCLEMSENSKDINIDKYIIKTIQDISNIVNKVEDVNERKKIFRNYFNQIYMSWKNDF